MSEEPHSETSPTPTLQRRMRKWGHYDIVNIFLLVAVGVAVIWFSDLLFTKSMAGRYDTVVQLDPMTNQVQVVRTSNPVAYSEDT